MPNATLCLAWSYISHVVVDLFQAYIDVVHHPIAFGPLLQLQSADTTSLVDQTLRLIRPIALIFVLGNGLERLVARWTSWIAIKHEVLACQNFGALSLRLVPMSLLHLNMT